MVVVCFGFVVVAGGGAVADSVAEEEEDQVVAVGSCIVVGLWGRIVVVGIDSLVVEFDTVVAVADDMLGQWIVEAVLRKVIAGNLMEIAGNMMGAVIVESMLTVEGLLVVEGMIIAEDSMEHRFFESWS